MAIVLDKGTGKIDIGSYKTHTRSNAGEPNGVVTPAFAGEIILDTTNNRRWKATGLTNGTWVAIDPTG